jgi:hypothetical protein
VVFNKAETGLKTLLQEDSRPFCSFVFETNGDLYCLIVARKLQDLRVERASL